MAIRRRYLLFCKLLLLLTLAGVGCRPATPFYLRGSSDDLSYYLDSATQVEYPDMDTPILDEVNRARSPITLSDPDFDDFWDLSLQDVISIALHNSKTIRNLGAVIQPNAPIARPETFATVYDPAVIESDPQLGVEGALSAFDVQLATSIFWDKRDRPQNFGFFIPVLEQDVALFNFELSKRSAWGTQWFFRNVTDYENNNNSFQSVSSAYTTAFEVEARQPILRGAGAQVNRVPVVLARINTDISLTDFEAGVRNLVLDLENAYWDLSCAYRTMQAAKTGRDRSLDTWRKIDLRVRGGREPPENEPLVREQYLNFRLALESSLRELNDKENNLRWLMGLAATDGRIIRPVDEPTVARVRFDWDQIHSESLARTPELRRQKWLIKQRELQLIAAKNQILPEINLVGLYRWLGTGDQLVAASGNHARFPQPGSTAFEELTSGDFQEVRFGVELAWPVGYRRELAQLRNSELDLIREKVRLEDMQLNVSHLLTLAVRQMDTNYRFAETHFNRMLSAESEAEKRQALLVRRSDLAFLQSLLDAQRRSAQSRADYHRALCDYNKSIALLHHRKGSLLDYDNVRLAEGPWPEQAYLNAHQHARRRSASVALNYGWTRPADISRGSYQAMTDPEAAQNQGVHEAVPAGQPWPSDADDPPQNKEVNNTGQLHRLPPTHAPWTQTTRPDANSPNETKRLSSVVLASFDDEDPGPIQPLRILPPAIPVRRADRDLVSKASDLAGNSRWVTPLRIFKHIAQPMQ